MKLFLMILFVYLLIGTIFCVAFASTDYPDDERLQPRHVLLILACWPLMLLVLIVLGLSWLWRDCSRRRWQRRWHHNHRNSH